MRLTQEKRRTIVNTESSNKFYDNLAKNEKAIYDECNKLAKKGTPSWVTDDILASGYLNTTNNFNIKGEKYYYFNRTMDLSNGMQLYNYLPQKGYDDSQIEKSKTLINLLSKRALLLDSREKFKLDLRQVLCGYTTVKKLLEAVPELKEHFKNEVASSALVPVEQIVRVRKSIKK